MTTPDHIFDSAKIERELGWKVLMLLTLHRQTTICFDLYRIPLME